MSGNIDCCRNYNFYRHGIVCRSCIVRKYGAGSAVGTVQVGSLVEIHGAQQENLIFRVVNGEMEIVDDLFICEKGDVLLVPENLWGPLLAVEEQSRLSIVQDTELAEALGNISVGNIVKVLVPDFKDTCIATVSFKNSIAKLGVGVYFGLKITDPLSNKLIKENFSLIEPGTKQFPRDCDIVVSVDKIRPLNLKEEVEKILVGENCKSTVGNKTNKSESTSSIFKSKSIFHVKDRLTGKTSHIKSGLSHSNWTGLNTKKKQGYNIPLSIGEQVVHISDVKPEKGTVRWIGLIENTLKVGIEFENPIGSGTGVVNGEELFKAKLSHAALMPPESLIKLSDFEMNNSRTYTSQQKTSGNYDNYNSMKSYNDCYSLKQNLDDKSKMPKDVMKSTKYDNSTHSRVGFYPKNCNEDFSNRNFEDDGTYKTEYTVPSCSIQCSQRSFDYSRPSSTNERKLDFNKQSRSMDNDLTRNNEFSPNLEVSIIPMQKSPNKDLDEIVHGNGRASCELHNIPFDYDYHDHYDYLHSRKKRNTQSKDQEDWETLNSEHSGSDESGDHYDVPKPSEKLGEGSLVELRRKDKAYFGVIRWIGHIPDDGDVNPRLMAGIEMETENNDFTDGTFRNLKYFSCNPRKALFVPLSKCRKDSRFIEENNRHSNGMKINSFGQVDCPIVEGTIPPINLKNGLEAFCGKNRGIQGHHNSCYLDATLFSMFAFTSVFDSLLYRPPTASDIPHYLEVQRVLKEEIVNPLRKNLYVRADRVMKLRTWLENLSSVSGLTCDEKDPEEFLNSLLSQILRAEPFLKLSSGQETFYYQLFVEKDERLVFPSVQQLFEQSFITSDIKLKQVPSCLIIQMPRFGRSFKMYSRIFPPQLLDVTDIIENSPRQCIGCGKLAKFECKDCFGQGDIGKNFESKSYCNPCFQRFHTHNVRLGHNYRMVTVPFEFSDVQEQSTIPRINMELFAVVCIETSHYVAFVKCGTEADAPWCFFDSMADRKGERNGYNIPEVVPCPDLPFWLSEEGMKALSEMEEERKLPELARRLLCDAYMCMYQSPELMMYR